MQKYTAINELLGARSFNLLSLSLTATEVLQLDQGKNELRRIINVRLREGGRKREREKEGGEKMKRKREKNRERRRAKKCRDTAREVKQKI